MINWYVVGNASRTLVLEAICDKHMVRFPVYPKEIGGMAEIFYGLIITKVGEDRAKGFIKLCGLEADSNAFECDWCRRASEGFGDAK